MSDIKRGNVLVIGGSGVGKSTLINAMIGEDEGDIKQETSYGTEGITKHLTIVEPKGIPFRLIDTIGFEISFIKRQKAINAVKKWSRDSAAAGNEDTQINVIWFCVDGTNSKLFPETIKALASATSIYSNAPMIVVITKSFSKINQEKSIELVKTAFSKEKRYRDRMPKIIPVVAEAYPVDENTVVEPQGITELIEMTNDLMPEGLKAAQQDLARYTKARRQFLAHGLVLASAATGAGSTLVNINKVQDSQILTALEIKELNSIAKIYKLENEKGITAFLDAIIANGGVSVLAKLANSAALAAVENNPKLKIAANIVNATVAAIVMITIGEIAINAMEKVYSGEKTLDDIDWLKDVINKDTADRVRDNTEKITSKLPEKPSFNDILNSIAEVFTKNDDTDKPMNEKKKSCKRNKQTR